MVLSNPVWEMSLIAASAGAYPIRVGVTHRLTSAVLHVPIVQLAMSSGRVVGADSDCTLWSTRGRLFVDTHTCTYVSWLEVLFVLIQMKINRVMSKDTSGSPINLLRELIHLSVIKEPVY